MKSKLQTPTSNIQRSSKFQIPNHMRRLGSEYWSLKFLCPSSVAGVRAEQELRNNWVSMLAANTTRILRRVESLDVGVWNFSPATIPGR